jgi:hypothetical protein
MGKFSNELNNLSLGELQKLLSELRLYNSLVKQLWNRWKALYSRLETWEEVYEVEYFPAMTKETALSEAKIAFKKCFWVDIKDDSIVTLKPKKALSWWIRVYLGDKMVDLSYEKIEKALIK